MGNRVAMFSGGKDGLRAAQLSWPIDIFLFLVYEFPEPSPHIENLGATAAAAGSIGVPLLVARLDRGKEFQQTAAILRRLSADVLVAGDVFVEDHLKYMESLAKEAGATLREPLWGMNTLEILMKDVEEGYSFKVLGARPKNLRRAVGSIIHKGNVDWFLGLAKADGADPLGENGEYHTVVVGSPLHRWNLELFDARRLSLKCCDLLYVLAPYSREAKESFVTV
ncbi:MAG: ATPase [Acidilobus sp.]